MHSLFLDTTAGLTIGILTREYRWLSYRRFAEQKSSAILHLEIEKILREQNIECQDLQSAFFVAGPGSYTGIRLADGIQQVFTWQGIKSFSFYHHHVPAYLGKSSYHFVCHAFKQELFSYEVNQGEIREERLPLVNDKFSNDHKTVLYTYERELPASCAQRERLSTQDLIESEPEIIFNNIVLENTHRPVFYFRHLHEEFHVKDRG